MSRSCQGCGMEMRADAPLGHCAHCLVQLGLAGDVPAEGETLPPGIQAPPIANPQSRRFGDYELLGEIAQGGMGVVYKARQLSLNRTVAVKMIRSGAFASKEFVHRFRVEASAAAVLQHPNIVAVHEVGVHEGQHFFSMDYVAGKNLAQLAADGPLPANRAARYVQKIAEAIHYAHESGILHRDLKPSNVLIDSTDQPRITDFGLAKQLNSESSATLTGDIMGTPGYMPPEQASGNRGEVKAWSDVYSIGAILYHLLTGRAPFAAGTLEATLNQMLHQDPVSLRLLNPAVPHDLNTICLKCLGKEPTKRYGSAHDLAEELTRFLNQEPILARPISAVGKTWRWCRRKPALATAVSLVLVVAIGSPIAALRINRTRHAEQRQRQLAQAAVTKLEIVAAENLFEKDKSAEALGYLARVLRREPTNRVAAERILSALSYRKFCLPLARLPHEAEVTAAQFSPDGRQVLTASRDRSARVWDSRSGRLLISLQHTNEVLTAQFSPDGRSVVTASGDQMARIWDVARAQSLRELPHDAPVLCAAFSADGRKIVTGGRDQSVQVWATGTAETLAGPFHLGAPVDYVQFSADGTLIAAMSLGGRPAWVIDAENGGEVAIFPTGSVYRMDQRTGPCLPHFNWEADRVIAGSSLTAATIWATIWTLKPRQSVLARLGHPLVPHSVILSPDGALAATASQDNTAQLWEARTGKRLGGPLRHQDWVNSVRFSPDGRQLATGSKDNTARLWDAVSGEPLSEPLQHPSALLSVQFSGDGCLLLTVCADGSVWVWALRSRHAIARTLQHVSNVRMAVFSPDGGRVATVEWLGRVRVWSPRAADSLITSLRISGAGPFQGVQFSPDGRWVAIVCGATTSSSAFAQIWDTTKADTTGVILDRNLDGLESVRFSPTSQHVVTAGQTTNAMVWELSSGRLVSRLPHRARSHFARFSPDGQWVLTASYDKTAQVWDWRTGMARLWDPLRHHDAVVCADISPDGKWIATLSYDKTARIWDARTGRMRTPPLHHAEEPYHYNSIQFSPDGRWLVTAAGNAAQVWDSVTGQPVTGVLKHNARVNAVRFSPDSERVVTACTDGAARIWDVKAGHPLGEPFRHNGRVHYAEFSPDGRWLVTASVDSTARLWEVPQLRGAVPTWLAELAEAIAGQRLLEGDINEMVAFEKLARLRQTLLSHPASGEPTQWARWFLAEDPTRTLSLSSPITVPDYVNARIQDETFTGWQEAVALSPTHQLAQAKFTFAELTNGLENPRQMRRSDWQSLRAARLAPRDPGVLWARAQVCERLGKFSEALGTMERGGTLNPTDAAFWNAWGLLLEQTNRVADALQCYTRAIELSGPWKDSRSLPATAWLNRSKLLRSVNRLPEATADNLKGLNLPARDEETPPTLLDLSLHYNLSAEMRPNAASPAHLAGLPVGRIDLAGVGFDVRGILRLAMDPSDDFPREITGIRIDQKCRYLHFLHSALGSASEGTPIGAYLVHYTDGQRTNIAIRYGQDLRNRLHDMDPRSAGLATAFLSEVEGRGIRCYKRIWDNPRPDVAIASIDFISNAAGAAPFLIAITAEP